MNVRISLLMMAAGLLAGCSHSTTATEPAGRPGSAQSGAQNDASQALQKGMTAGEVEKLLGKPDAVRPFKSSEAEGKAEVWVYSRMLGTKAKIEGTGVEETLSAMDSEIGVVHAIPEPVYSQKLVTVVEELQLLWFDGNLVTWKRVRKGDTAYY